MYIYVTIKIDSLLCLSVSRPASLSPCSVCLSVSIPFPLAYAPLESDYQNRLPALSPTPETRSCPFLASPPLSLPCLSLGSLSHCLPQLDPAASKRTKRKS